LDSATRFALAAKGFVGCGNPVSTWNDNKNAGIPANAGIQ
jgi:hypothetical protein